MHQRTDSPLPPRRISAAFRVIPILAPALAIATSSLALLGWSFGLGTLKQIRPGLVAMNPVTALTFVLTAIAILLLRGPSPARLRSPSH